MFIRVSRTAVVFTVMAIMTNDLVKMSSHENVDDLLMEGNFSDITSNETGAENVASTRNLLRDYSVTTQDNTNSTPSVKKKTITTQQIPLLRKTYPPSEILEKQVEFPQLLKEQLPASTAKSSSTEQLSEKMRTLTQSSYLDINVSESTIQGDASVELRLPNFIQSPDLDLANPHRGGRPSPEEPPWHRWWWITRRTRWTRPSHFTRVMTAPKKSTTTMTTLTTTITTTTPTSITTTTTTTTITTPTTTTTATTTTTTTPTTTTTTPTTTTTAPATTVPPTKEMTTKDTTTHKPTTTTTTSKATTTTAATTTTTKTTTKATRTATPPTIRPSSPRTPATLPAVNVDHTSTLISANSSITVAKKIVGEKTKKKRKREKSDYTLIVFLWILAAILVTGVLGYVYYDHRKAKAAKNRYRAEMEEEERIRRNRKARRRKRPRQMSAAKINMKEFKEEGPLVMQAAFRGDVKHQLDNEKSTSLKNLKFDPAQNSLVWIGTEIEKVEGQSQRTIVKTREGTLDSSIKKARERSAYKELSLMKTQMSTEETGNKTAKPEKLAKQAKLRRLRSNSGDRKKSSTKKK